MHVDPYLLFMECAEYVNVNLLSMFTLIYVFCEKHKKTCKTSDANQAQGSHYENVPIQIAVDSRYLEFQGTL